MLPFKSILRFGVLAGLAGTLSVLAGMAGASLHWSFDLVAQFLLPATVVGTGVFATALMFGWVRLAAVAAIATIVALAMAMPFSAAPAGVAQAAPRFKLLLFNVWYRNGRLEDVRRMIERSDADIVVLIETTTRIRDALLPLSGKYPYRLDCVGAGGCDVLMFSRSRLTLVEVKSTSDPEGSPLVSVETKIAGCRFTLFATHLTRPFPNRPFWAQRSQAREIGADVGAVPGAKLVVGDFNAAPWGYIMRTIGERGGVEILTGAGGTWPSGLAPQLRIPIDNMLAGEGLTFVSRRVLPAVGSDHLPVLAEIAVGDAAACR
jgi:endonuclease/exonuclease/phosphatase (EEP) superfamily protein YafD